MIIVVTFFVNIMIESMSDNNLMIENLPIIISTISLLLSIVSIYLQYRAGKIFIPKIKSIGLHFQEKEQENGVINIIAIIPVLFYNTGNRVIGVSDARISIPIKNANIYLQYKKNTKNLGVGHSNLINFPQVSSIAHQFLIKPKESCFFYLLFEEKVNKSIANQVSNQEYFEFILELTSSKNDKYEPYYKTGVILNDTKRTTLYDKYSIFFLKKN